MVVKQSAYGGCRLSETRRTVSFDRRLKKHKQEDDLWNGAFLSNPGRKGLWIAKHFGS